MEDLRESKYIAIMVILLIGLLLIYYNDSKKSTIIIEGTSMEPALTSGDMYRVRDIESPINYQDIVICKSNTGENIIKRIWGVPGDIIEIREGMLYRNGKAERTFRDYTKLRRELGNDEYFILGDNQDTSKDSRLYGVIKKDIIIGLLGEKVN